MLLGLRYDHVEGEVMCGGSVLYEEEVRMVLGLFSHQVPEMKQHSGSHRHKQWVLGVSSKVWRDGLTLLEEEGYQLRETKTFRRLMS